jgi:hypothetical protein
LNGAAFAVLIMAASLEVAKLVIASLLYQYRKGLPKLLKYYFYYFVLVGKFFFVWVKCVGALFLRQK